MNHISSELRARLEDAKEPPFITAKYLVSDVHVVQSGADKNFVQACFTVCFLNGVLEEELLRRLDERRAVTVQEVTRFITALSHEARWKVVEQTDKEEIPKGYTRMWEITQQGTTRMLALCQGKGPVNPEGLQNDIIHVWGRFAAPVSHTSHDPETGKKITEEYQYLDGDFLFPNTVTKSLALIKFMRFFVN